LDDYESVISNTDWISDKPIGYSVLNQYRSAILDLHAQQRDGGCNNIPKEVLMSGRVKRLLKTVKMRKTQIAKRNFDEKLPVNSRHTLLLKIYQDLKIFSFKIIRYHPFIQWHLYVIDILPPRHRATLFVQGQWITGHVSMQIREASYQGSLEQHICAWNGWDTKRIFEMVDWLARH